MPKLTALLPGGKTSVPIAPTVAEEIANAERDLAALEAGRGAAALSAMTDGGDVNALAKLDAEAASIRTKIFNLQAAYRAANERDARQAAAAWYRQRLSELGTFEDALDRRTAAVGKFCDAIKVAAEAYRDILDLSDAVDVMLPQGTQLPSGFSAHHGEVRVDGQSHAAPLDHLAKFEMFRHSGITIPGEQSRALPGAEPFSVSTMFNSAAVEPWHESSKRLNKYLVEAVKNQIELGHQLEVEAIDEAMEANVA
ncbi:hypothetical protein [Bradyrhizobium sp. dw_411]|uniref:hypothetical protein n=1 Tax=Bradyrhizobium sp. dw_411 TaxID=2720082 RepID=UPI001BCBA41A|nr:hypothetical protein [Bradyrhizobium sp. dw_411]